MNGRNKKATIYFIWSWRKIVGDNGQVFLTGLPDEGGLTVQWGSGAGQHCQVPFRLPAAREEDTGVPLQVQEVCR
ncbi:hypothetical protein CF471_21385 [Salmonella enterica]|nr:hypothetical protein [Salmonella enterica]ECJ3906451.1 hypothetical protein [Salmonella enterica subsp. enterica serovar Poona]EDU8777177.1 hypothetical protein [Salmonella enterica subsp. enterica serovar Poona]EJO2225667.1 hypothetical protein [Salmonella enterica]